MHAKTTLALLSAAALGRAATDAPETSDNPPSVVYKAEIKDVFFADAVLPGDLKGHITAQAPKDGKGVKFDVHFENLPEEGGPFSTYSHTLERDVALRYTRETRFTNTNLPIAYHLHKAAVPSDGNCTATLTHLDPYEAGAEIKCNKDKPETCEVGDLSGKHGAIDDTSYEESYLDLYASTNVADAGYFGDLSFVIHYENSTRLACANFVKEHSKPHPTPGHNSTVTLRPTSNPTGSKPTGAKPTTSEPATEPTGEPSGEPAEPEPTDTPESGAAQLSFLSGTAMLLGAAALAFGL